MYLKIKRIGTSPTEEVILKMDIFSG